MSGESGKSRGRARPRTRPFALEGEPSTSSGWTSSPSPTLMEVSESVPSSVRGRAGRFINTIPSNVDAVHATETFGCKEITLIANYFRLVVPIEQLVYDYHVDFEPDVESYKQRRLLIAEHHDKFGDAYIFDGASNLKSLKRFDRIHLIGRTRTDGAMINISIRFSSAVSWGHPEMLRLYNTQMRRNMRHLGYTIIGRHFFDESKRKNLPQYRLQIWPGFQNAINEHEKDILLVSEYIHKFIRVDTVLESINRLRRQGNWRELVRKEIAGRTVMTSYNNKLYKVEDVDFSSNPRSTFERKYGPITYIAYYKEQYGKDIRYLDQPLLVVKSTQRIRGPLADKLILLVPELCFETGISKELNSRIMRDVDDFTRPSPFNRFNKIMEFSEALYRNQTVQKEMSSWGIYLERNPIRLTGRILPCESIVLKERILPIESDKGDFKQKIQSDALFVSCSIRKFAIVAPRETRNVIHSYVKALGEVSSPLGVIIGSPSVYFLDDERTNNYIEQIVELTKFDLVNVIVPNNNKERYDAIKRTLCVEHPVPSQVVVARTLSKNLMSVCTKLIYQMAAKVGAEPWTIPIKMPRVMVVGYDTYHDFLGRTRSVGAFVCNMNDNVTRWYSRVSFHHNREELSNNLSLHFSCKKFPISYKNYNCFYLTDAIKRYYKLHNFYPSRIIFYRDGVSEGQIAYVYEYELQQVKKVINEFISDLPIKFAFIIVTKRISTRFFARYGTSFVNPPCGTVVDDVVTRKERYDFFLVSQSTNKGVVSPTMYNIIYDTSGLKPQHHQLFAYKMCHLYYNCQNTISVPAPCRLAHKLAHLTGTSLHKEHHQDLSKVLFYL